MYTTENEQLPNEMEHIALQTTSSTRTAATHRSSLSSSSSSLSTTGSSSRNRPSPSLTRRRALEEADRAHKTEVVDSYPLASYVAIAERLYGYFQESFEQLNLDEAYVYGMRFAQLGLASLPGHREWIDGGDTQEHLRSQLTTVLSRLEIIKRRMDEEETAKLKVRMLARAEEETLKQDRFHREKQNQQSRRVVLGHKGNRWNGKRSKGASSLVEAEIEAMKQFASSKYPENPGISYLKEDFSSENPAEKVLTKLRIPSKGKEATKKLRKLLGFPKPTGSHSIQGETSILPSIRRSRAQHELHGGSTGRSNLPPVPTTRYTIHELPAVEEVTLRLHAAQLPSTFLDENRTGNPAHDDVLLLEFDEPPREPPSRGHKQAERITSSESPAREKTLSLPLQIREASHTTSVSEITLPPEASNATENSGKATARTMIERNERLIHGDVKKIYSSSPESSEINSTREAVLAIIVRRLLLSGGFEQDLIDRYELVLIELRKKLASMYIGHYLIVQSNWKNNDKSFDKYALYDLVVVELKKKLSTMYTGHHVIVESNWQDDDETAHKNGRVDLRSPTQTMVHQTVNSHLDAESVQEEIVSANERAKNKINFDTFDKFDAFLAKRAPIGGEEDDDEEESYMELTVLEEETIDSTSQGVVAEHKATDEKNYLEYVIEEETVEDDESYLEYTVVEDSVRSYHTKDQPKAPNASAVTTTSPNCVASDKIVSLDKPTDESLHNYPSVNVRPSIDIDDMTYITMDTWLQDIDTTEETSLRYL